MAEDVPDFPYYADPLADGCFEQRAITCEVCGQQRDWVYVGVMYTEDEPESICPWCIADGRAAARFDGTFQDVSFADAASRESIDAVLTRTPSVATWNPIDWPDHCGECCTYMGDFQLEQHRHLLSLQTVQEDLAGIGGEIQLSPEELPQLAENGSLWLRLFKCRLCGVYRLALDLD